MINHNFVIPKSTGKSTDNPLENSQLYFICGGTGSGKSTLIGNLLMALDAEHDWDNTLYVTGNNRDELLESIEMPVTTSPKDLEDFITKVKQPTEEPTYNLLIMDDIQGSPDFNIMTGRSVFSKFMLSHRHFGKVDGKGGTWIIVTAQTLKNSYSTTFRKNVNLWFTFYPRDEDEIKSIELVSGDREKMRKAMALQKMSGKHSFLFINKIDPTDIKYFLGFKKEIDVT